MKKRKDWIRKADKRKKKKKDRGVVDFVKITYHFFQDLPHWINELEDPRNPSYITYTQADFVWMGLLKNICSVLTMRSMGEQFSEEECICILRLLSGDQSLEEMSHCDTLNYYLKKLSPVCLSDLRKQMVKKLIRNKSFYKGRLSRKYWRVIIDGAGLFYFKEKHCENCLVTKIDREDGKKEIRYYYKVLEAKMVLSDRIVINLGTEFIENEDKTVTRNDCELNAVRCLLDRIKKEYLKLPICMQGYALYAAGSIIKLCCEKNWKYILTQKETRQPLLAESYEWIKQGDGAEKVKGTGKEQGTGSFVNYVERQQEKKRQQICMNTVMKKLIKREKRRNTDSNGSQILV